MCSLLGYADEEREEVIRSVEALAPFLCAQGSLQGALYGYFF